MTPGPHVVPPERSHAWPLLGLGEAAAPGDGPRPLTWIGGGDDLHHLTRAPEARGTRPSQPPAPARTPQDPCAGSPSLLLVGELEPQGRADTCQTYLFGNLQKIKENVLDPRSGQLRSEMPPTTVIVSEMPPTAVIVSFAVPFLCSFSNINRVDGVIIFQGTQSTPTLNKRIL